MEICSKHKLPVGCSSLPLPQFEPQSRVWHNHVRINHIWNHIFLLIFLWVHIPVEMELDYAVDFICIMNMDLLMNMIVIVMMIMGLLTLFIFYFQGSCSLSLSGWIVRNTCHISCTCLLLTWILKKLALMFMCVIIIHTPLQHIQDVRPIQAHPYHVVNKWKYGHEISHCHFAYIR